MKRILLVAAVALGLGALAWFLVPQYLTRDSLAKAETALENEMWEYAREKLDQYLRVHPQDARAHLLMAEAYARDNSATVSDLRVALEHLNAIPDTSQYFIDARIKAARLHLFVFRQPSLAEGALQVAIDRSPDSYDGNFMMWKLYDITGRGYLAGDFFWKVYKAEEESEKGPRLREWYMTQFFPTTANPEIVAQMRLEPLPDIADPEVLPLLHFYLAERDYSPLAHALIAKWYLEDNDPDQAIELLVDGAKKLDDEGSEPLYLATLVQAHLDKGNLETADKIFQQWPEASQRGYDYTVVKALVLDRVRGEYAEAAEAYREALSREWPSPVEWPLQNRLANCLAKQGKHEEAAKIRQRADQAADMMVRERHVEMRDALRDIHDPVRLKTVRKFYEELGCPREAAAWKQIIEKLEKDNAKRLSLETSP